MSENLKKCKSGPQSMARSISKCLWLKLSSWVGRHCFYDLISKLSSDIKHYKKNCLPIYKTVRDDFGLNAPQLWTLPKRYQNVDNILSLIAKHFIECRSLSTALNTVSPRIGRTSVPKKSRPIWNRTIGVYTNMCKKSHYFKEISLITVSASIR